jgi:serine/threonine protein phosphatase 1
MKQRSYVIGDIHGGLAALKQILSKAPIQPEDCLIFLGDYVDGWSESPAVLDFLIDLQTKQNCVFMRGNHDDLLINFLKTGNFASEWFIHGGKSTIDAYKIVPKTVVHQHIQFLASLTDYHIDDENRLFVHAGFSNQKGVNFEYFKENLYWDRTLWEMVLALNPTLSPNDLFYPTRLKQYHEIFIGHTPTTRIGHTTPVQKANVWNLDTGAAFKGSLTIMDVETKEFWQSDPLPELYPNENGRNSSR